MNNPPSPMAYLHLKYDGDYIVDKNGLAHGIRIKATARLAEIKSMSPDELYEMRACIAFDQYDKIPARFKKLLSHIAYPEKQLSPPPPHGSV